MEEFGIDTNDCVGHRRDRQSTAKVCQHQPVSIENLQTLLLTQAMIGTTWSQKSLGSQLDIL